MIVSFDFYAASTPFRAAVLLFVPLPSSSCRGVPSWIVNIQTSHVCFPHFVAHPSCLRLAFIPFRLAHCFSLRAVELTHSNFQPSRHIRVSPALSIYICLLDFLMTSFRPGNREKAVSFKPTPLACSILLPLCLFLFPDFATMFSARVFLIFHDHEREQEQDIPTPTRTRVTNATSTRPALALANAVPAKPSNGGARLVRAPAKPDHAENAKGKGKEKKEEAKDKAWPPARTRTRSRAGAGRRRMELRLRLPMGRRLRLPMRKRGIPFLVLVLVHAFLFRVRARRLRRVRVQGQNGSGESEAQGDCDRYRGKAAKRGCVAGAAIDDDDEEQRYTHASSSSSRAEAQAETQTQNGVYKHEGVNRCHSCACAASPPPL
ncbi:hypothetical protein C8R45DRAFT_193815 [Mycena sanguinolenta]|nr:hypothetical protein C8R45DRAFT_193815 [Mycena sanguinolenta]